MKLPDTSVLTKANAIISVIATIVYIVGFACPYWLVKDFVLEAMPPTLFLDVYVNANIGLFYACKVARTFLAVEMDECSPDGAADWQRLCAGLAIAALVLAVASCVLSVLNVVVAKLAKAHLLLKLLTASLTFVAAGFIIAVLIMMHKNKFIQVYPPHPHQEEFNLGWAYLVTLASASAFVLLVITSVVDIIWGNTHTCSG